MNDRVRRVDPGPRRPVEVKLTADLAAVERCFVDLGERCEIEGVGPIAVTVARALLQDAKVGLLIGEGDDIGTVTSPKPTIPRRMRRRLEVRDPVARRRRRQGTPHPRAPRRPRSARVADGR